MRVCVFSSFNKKEPVGKEKKKEEKAWMNG